MKRILLYLAMCCATILQMSCGGNVQDANIAQIPIIVEETSKVPKINYSNYETCPNCDGKHLLFRIGADYD